MFRSRLLIVLTVVAVVFSVTAVMWGRRVTTSEPLFYSDTFAQALTRRGIRVENTTQGHELFESGAKGSYGFHTELASVEVSFFPTNVEGQIWVEQLGQFSWKIYGWQQPQEMGANHRLFFVVHRNLLMIVHDERLYTAMLNAFNMRTDGAVRNQ